VLQDTFHYQQGLDYIEALGLSECDEYLRKYGQVLMEALPEETTMFLIKFTCQNSLSPLSVRMNPEITFMYFTDLVRKSRR
jgi:hypothetical protein